MSDIAHHPQLDRPVKLTVSFTHSCNLRCATCYADCTPEPDPAELGARQWTEFLGQVHDAGVLSLLFEGGEPLHRRDDLLEVLQFCGPRFFTRVRTNGTLVTPQLARELARRNVGGMLVDFLGADAQTHDALTGVPGSFEGSCAAVRYLREAGLDTEMLLILNARNAHQMLGYRDLAVRLGVSMMSILRLYPIGRAKRNWRELSMGIDEMMSVVNGIPPRAGLEINHSWHPRDGNTCWQMAAVNAYGESIGCTYLRELVSFGNVTEVPFLDTWEDPLYRELRSGNVRSACSSCEKTQGSRGGCRATAYAFHGDWRAPDPYCSRSNDGVDLRELPEWMLQPRPRPETEGIA